MLSKAFEQSELNRSDVSLVYRPVAEHHDLWRTGKVEALITYLPISEDIKQQCSTLFDSRSMPNTIFDVLAVRTGILNKKRENIKSLLDGYFKTLQEVRVDNQNIIYQLSAQLNMPAMDIEETLRNLILPGLSYNRRLLSGPKPLLTEQTAGLMKTMIKSGIIDKRDQGENLVTATFLPRT